MKNSSKLKAMALSCLMITAPVAQADFMGILNNVMATVNPNAGIVGPVYRHKTKQKDQYGDQLLKIILSEAHRSAKKYEAEGNTDAYNAFMILALSVPNQEGLMVHFREVKARSKYCRDDRSQGKGIKSSKAKKQFQRTLNNRGLLRDPNNGFLVPCEKIEGAKNYTQLIVGGSDGSDVGIMQLSALWHYEEFLKEVKYASVKSTVRYGLSYIKRRFHSNLMKNKECIMNEDGSVNYTDLIRGSWSAYNGGPSSFCRFADSTSPHASKDKGFKGSVQKTLDFNDGRFFGFNEDGQLPLSEDAKAALNEVVSNFENGTSKKEAFNKFVAQ